jgi:hypothetical protein
MLKKKYIILDNDKIEDRTLYDSIKEVQFVLENVDFADGDSVVIYELVPKSEFVVPCGWKKVK